MRSAVRERERTFPVGATVALDQLDDDPHPVLAKLRAREPVSWLPALDGWLVTRYDDAVAVMRDPDRFTVADPRFSTGQVLGPSMLSLDGTEHVRHRAPFVAPFRARAVRRTFSTDAAAETARLVDRLAHRRAGELRRGFAGPLAAAIVGRALGLDQGEERAVLRWYDAIVDAVTAITAGRAVTPEGRAAFQELRRYLLGAIEHEPADSLLAGIAAQPELTHDEIVSNAAVLLFGGVETTEGMISNVLLHLLERPELLDIVRADQVLLAAAIEESLRLEPAASVVDRYTTEAISLRGASIEAGELVRVSIAAANRDPAVFSDADMFDLDRANSRRHIAFAQGAHVCLGIHLARLEAQTGLSVLLASLPRLRLDRARPPRVRGIVFRKPSALHALWD
ncbi:MAG: cytochrome P450 [Solirubrobacterales bacterium]|nr:cytochrome P450 [Solirubrobacterales bacterium]